MAKKLLIILIVIILGLSLTVLLKDFISKGILTGVLKLATGVGVEISDVDCNILDNNLIIKGLKVYNPQGFGQGVLLDVSKIDITYEPSEIFKGVIYLFSLEIDLKELVVIKDKDGNLNVDALKFAKQSQENVETAQQDNKAEEKQDSDNFYVEKLILSAKQVVYKDYTKDPDGAIKIYDLGIKNKVYKEVPGLFSLMVIVLKAPMKDTTIKGALIYGAATAAGVGFLPAGVAITVVGKDHAQASSEKDFDLVYQAALETAKGIGEIKSQDRQKGEVRGVLKGHRVTIKIRDSEDKNIEVTVSARKLMLPRPKFAKTVLYRIFEKLR